MVSAFHPSTLQPQECRVVVADDNGDNADTLAMVLESMGFAWTSPEDRMR